MDEEVQEVEVVTERPADTATGRTLDRAAIETFPADSADELLRAVPGLHLSAHGGNGKAYQLLVRGFDAEHGSDVLVTLDGVPLNEPSNIHGQGYIDLHFLPTSIVDGLEVVKGSYRARDGDFAITGTADYRVGAREGLRFGVEGGTDLTGGASVAWRPEGRGPGSFAVGELEGGRGYGDGRGYRQARLAAGLDGKIGATNARAMAFAYDGEFESPGVLRSDDLAAGEIGFWSAYPESGGGHSRRLLAIAALDGSRHNGAYRATAWAGARGLTLDQNYTGYLVDPVHGDGTRQDQVAGDGGARLEARHTGAIAQQPYAVSAGADLRAGRVSGTRHGLTPGGREWASLPDTDTRQLDAGLWAEGRIVLAERLTLIPGLRSDTLELQVDDGGWTQSTATVLSPKGTLALRVVDDLALFAAAGRGFRTPPALATADGDRVPVMLSTSAEAGLRAGPEALTLSATGFSVNVSDELIFDHLVAQLVSAGRTRRLGVEAVVDARPADWLRLQADMTYTDGRFVTTGAPIPYAPRLLVAGGAFLESAPIGEALLSGGLRTYVLGQRPLPDGFASHAAVVGNLVSKLEIGRTTLGLEVDNLFLQQWRDGEFVFPSWFDRSEPRSELKVLHVTAGDPFVATLSVGRRW